MMFLLYGWVVNLFIFLLIVFLNLSFYCLCYSFTDLKQLSKGRLWEKKMPLQTINVLCFSYMLCNWQHLLKTIQMNLKCGSSVCDLWFLVMIKDELSVSCSSVWLICFYLHTRHWGKKWVQSETRIYLSL